MENLKIYSSKKELLERCKRDGKDVRWFERMIERGNIIKVESDGDIVGYLIRVELSNWMVRQGEMMIREYQKGERKE